LIGHVNIFTLAIHKNKIKVNKSNNLKIQIFYWTSI